MSSNKHLDTGIKLLATIGVIALLTVFVSKFKQLASPYDSNGYAYVYCVKPFGKAYEECYFKVEQAYNKAGKNKTTPIYVRRKHKRYDNEILK